MIWLLCIFCAAKTVCGNCINLICKNQKVLAILTQGNLLKHAIIKRRVQQNGGRMTIIKCIICSSIALAAATHAQDSAVVTEPVLSQNTSVEQPAPVMATKALPAGTPVIVALDTELSTQSSQLGDGFFVTVVNDVMQDGTVIIPKGTRGRGEITFLTKKGSFGKPGIIGIALRDMELNGRTLLLDGRFREEGGNNSGGATATMMAGGILATPIALLVKGKSSVIPAGRELKGRTGEDISAPAPIAENATPTPPSSEVAPALETQTAEPTPPTQ
jgi:hypothetical protein